MVVEDVGNGGGFRDKGRENQCWYDVEDRVEGKGTGGKKDKFGVVEEEGNGGGLGLRGERGEIIICGILFLVGKKKGIWW